VVNCSKLLHTFRKKFFPQVRAAVAYRHVGLIFSRTSRSITFSSCFMGKEGCRYNWHSAVFLGWPFPVIKYKYIFQIKYTEAILSNSTLKLLWFEISKIDSNRELECSSPHIDAIELSLRYVMFTFYVNENGCRDEVRTVEKLQDRCSNFAMSTVELILWMHIWQWRRITFIFSAFPARVHRKRLVSLPPLMRP